jgi:anti-sigma factor RsiW
MERHESGEVLSALLDGELSREEAERASRHLISCEHCRSLQAGLKSAKFYLRLAPRRTMPAGLAADLQRRVDLMDFPAWKLPSIHWQRLVVPALGFMTAAIFLGLWAWDRALTPQPQISIEALLAAHELHRDEGFLMAAADPARVDFPTTLASYESEPTDR